MCFVFGEKKDPEEEVVRFIEDTVRLQIGEMLIQARTQASRHGSRHLSVEDLIFLIRHDRPKVNRLRTYLSWKDVRQKVKDSEADDGPDPVEPVNESENLEESDSDDTDEVEAYEDSKKRLQEADELTKAMTKEEYQHYADCRQASFTYRKAKRFREFINLGIYMDGNPHDEVMDVLGFLAYELVRSLCEAGSSYKRSLAQSTSSALKRARDQPTPSKTSSPSTTSNVDTPASKTRAAPSPPRLLIEPTSLFSQALEEPQSALNTPAATESGVQVLGAGTADTPLQLGEVNGGYVRETEGRAALKANGMRNWRGGVKRIKVGFF
ncbi:transcription initiation protein SPT3, partial [Phenoliferia sp. Uapishka_3]